MTLRKKQITDVVVSHAPHDKGIAELLTQELIEAGLAVSCISTLKPDEDFLDQFRVSLVECHAVVILLTRSQMESPNLAVEVGAAMAWNKPIYVLHDGLSVTEIPDYLQRFHIQPLNRISEVVAEIAASRKPLSDQDRATLVRAYQETGLSADQILLKPRAVSDLSSRYRKLARTAIPGERLVKELLRMRKKGELPRRSRLARS